MKILGIDPGIVNLGYCIVQDGYILRAGVATLDRKAPFFSELKHFARYLKKYGPFDAVLIERQMKSKFKICQTHLLHLFAPVSIIIAPQTIKRYFNYSGMKCYKQRKLRAIELTKNLCRENKQMELFEKCVRGRDKLDDVCDSYLIAHYGYTEFHKLKFNNDEVEKDWSKKRKIFEV